MGRSITSAVLAAALWLALPAAAHSAGLGRLTVLSSLGQPLSAEIEIVALQPGEEEGLVARLASLESFQQQGIELSPALVGMRFAIERRQKRPVLRVTTMQPVNEPFVDLLVELQWGTGRLIREYTVLLDPPEYKTRPAIAAAPPPPAPKPAVPEEIKPAPALESKPLDAAPAAAPAPATPQEPAPVAAAPAPGAAPAAPAAAAPAAIPGASHDVKKGDTLGAIARRNLPPGVTLNQMLVALYRANEDAFIRGNVNLVRAGRILKIPTADEALGAVDPAEANELVKTHAAQFADYRSRLAALPTRAEAAAGQREVGGPIESKPEAVPPAATQDQLRLSKADPKTPATPAARAARDDDSAARERALKEAQSRVTDLEKNVADLQKLLEIKNQQLAELEKKAGAKPAPAAPPPAAKAPDKPAAAAPTPAPTPAPVPTPAPAPGPVAEAPKPAAEAPKPAAEAPKPAAEAPKPPPAAAKPRPKPAPPPPQKTMLEEYAEDPVFLGALGLLVLLLIVYGVYTWRRKKSAQAKFQNSVLGAAAAGAAAGGALGEAGGGGGNPAVSQASVSQAPAGMEAEEVDPIAEADVYMAYGRDAQAEEILKEALQKDGSRTAVHAKLLEIYANRKDTKAFEQTALKLKNLTNGVGPEWEKAAALGRSIDPQNSSYGSGGGAAPAARAASSAPAPALDFDLGGPGQAGAPVPDISLDEPAKDGSASDATGIDFDIGGAKPAFDQTVKTLAAAQSDKTMTNIEFRLDDQKPQPAAPAPAAPAASSDGGLDFDLKLDLADDKADRPASQPPVDLASISLDLGAVGEPSSPAGGADPKWQEVATKLDLAKAYQEMGDKDGARELLNEVMKDGDAAQQGQAQQLLAKLA